jgi:transcriptional regulator with XRE-family HTH domain
MKFAEFIKKLRTDMKLNQEEFGKLIGVTQRTVSIYENGGFPREQKTIHSIASIAKMPVETVLAIINNMPKEEIFLLKLISDTKQKNVTWELFRDHINAIGSDNIDEEQWDQEMDADDSYCFNYKNVTYLLYKKNVNEMPTLILKIRYNDEYRVFSDNIKSGHILSLYNAIKASFSPFGGIIDDFLNEDFSKE